MQDKSVTFGHQNKEVKHQTIYWTIPRFLSFKATDLHCNFIDVFSLIFCTLLPLPVTLSNYCFLSILSVKTKIYHLVFLRGLTISRPIKRVVHHPRLHSPHLGQGTSAGPLVQKCCCVHTLTTRNVTVCILLLLHLAQSEAVLRNELNKAGRCPRTKTVCTGTHPLVSIGCTRSWTFTRAPVQCPNSSVVTWKEGVFTLVPREYRLRKSVKFSTTRHNRVRKKYHESFHDHIEFSYPGTCFSKVLAPTVQTLENTIHQINRYPADKYYGLNWARRWIFYELNSPSLAHSYETFDAGTRPYRYGRLSWFIITKGAGFGVYYS